MGPSQEPSMKCSICDTSFARQEHLTRHIRIHTREKPFQCRACGKSFSRMDVLNRHVASHEDAAAPQAPAFTRACKECASGRARCSKTLPCKRCVERGISCQYPTSRKRRVSTRGDGESTQDVLPSFPRVEESRLSYSAGTLAGDQLDEQNFQTGHGQLPEQGVFANIANDETWMNNMSVDLNQSPTNMYDIPPGLGMSVVNWMSPQNPQVMDWDRQLADFSITNNGVGVGQSFPFFFAGTDTGVDGWDAATRQSQTLDIPTQISRSSHGNVELASAQSVVSASTDGILYVEGTCARAPFAGQSNTRRSVVGIDALHERDTSVNMESMMQPSELVPRTAYQNMYAEIEAETSSDEVDMVGFPTHPQVEVFARHYFDKFHPVLPFLRKLSFPRECSESWILLLAVAVVGSRYLGRIHGSQPGAILHQTLQKALRRFLFNASFGDEDVPYVPGDESSVTQKGPRLPILQAGILNAICLLHSGKQSQVERAFLERQYLVQACHSLRLLSSIPPSSMLKAEDEQEGFRRWIKRESEIRTGMMIWQLDSMFAYEFNSKTLMSPDDIESPLPAREDLWEATEPRFLTPRKLSSMSLAEAVETLYMEKRLPQNLGEFGTGLLINAIYRKTKEVIAIERAQAHSWTPTALVQRRTRQPMIEERWPPMSQTLSKWRNSACDCLDLLHWSANSKAALLSGLESHTILHLHLSRLILLTPTAHIQTFASDSSKRQGAGPGNDRYIAARNMILQWAVRDQFKARLSVVHCGALFWHVRRYSKDSVMEPFAIYMATLVLWAFCVSVQFVGLVAVEKHASHESPSSSRHTAEGSDDLPDPSFIHLDRPLDDELVQTFVRLGHKMSGYITKVGNINDAEPSKVLNEGIRLLRRDDEPGSEPCFTWGIEGSFIESLERLLRATAEGHGGP